MRISNTSLVTAALLLVLSPSLVGSSRLMLLMIDAVRWDYITPGLEGFSEFSRRGVKAEYVTPVFPSVTLTNWFSILTGTYPDEHGMVNNYIWDEKADAYLLLTNITKNIDWLHREPIQFQAAREGKKVWTYYWAGCELAPSYARITYCKQPYPSPGTDFQEYKRSVLEAYTALRNGSADLAMLYLERLDVYGHFYGPESLAVKDAMGSLDEVLSALLREKEKQKGGKVKDDVNIILMSDHGMTDVTPEKVIDISGLIHDPLVKVILPSPPVTFVWAKDNMTFELHERVYNLHPHLSVYRKEQLPDRWRVKGHYRTPPIVLVADEGWSMIENATGYPMHDNYYYYYGDLPLLGYHGYDNDDVDMRGTFLALGPDFKEGYRQPGFMNLHAHQIMCHVLGITPATKHANWTEIGGMIREGGDTSSATRLSQLLYLFVTGAVICLLGSC